MKIILKLVLALVLLGAAVVGLLLANGTIDTTTLRMALNVMYGVSGPQTNANQVQHRYQVPPGFRVELFASQVPKARFLRFTPAGDLLVSRPHEGDIVLLRQDRDGDGMNDGMDTVISGLNRPQGMDFRDGWLYIAEREQVGRLPFDSQAGRASGDYQPLITGLTGDGNHWSKTLRFGPDGMLYLAQGSTCNVCVESDERRATMMRFQPDGSDGEIIATGLRNSVGFDWAPWDGGLYATDNGRDLLGDDFPPCELNLVEKGRFYGWPYFNGDNIPDPDMGPDPQADQRQPIPPVHGFRAHNAPLGIGFIDPAGWPAGYHRAALVALHGSWNRSEPDGYKVVSLHFAADGSITEKYFLDGFNRDGQISGRPVDVLQGPDGAVYVSDDYAGAIYRVTPGQASGAASATRMEAPASRLDATPPTWLATADLPAMAVAGERLYTQHDCAQCHEQGENPLSLANLSARLGYAAVLDTFNAPQAPMPLYSLSDQEQRELAVYLLTR